MGTNISDRIFKPDGTILGLNYCKASARRGAVLSISLGRGSRHPLLTSLMVDGRDFQGVYDQAVSLLAGYYGVVENTELVAEMCASSAAFLQANGLALQQVIYQQVVKPAE